MFLHSLQNYDDVTALNHSTHACVYNRLIGRQLFAVYSQDPPPPTQLSFLP